MKRIVYMNDPNKKRKMYYSIISDGYTDILKLSALYSRLLNKAGEMHRKKPCLDWFLKVPDYIFNEQDRKFKEDEVRRWSEFMEQDELPVFMDNDLISVEEFFKIVGYNYKTKKINSKTLRQFLKPE